MSGQDGAVKSPFSFNWGYIAFPLAVLLISVALALFFYGKLDPAQVAYRFRTDGSPGAYISRQAILFLMLGSQALLVLLAGLLTWGASRLRIFARVDPSEFWVSPALVLGFMGNIFGIPQLILSFALLDIFTYNVYQLHLMPLWLFAVVVIVLGAIVIGLLAIPVLLRGLRSFKDIGNKKE